MTQVTGIPYRRHGPSAAVRQFLDPLDPGDYFDCGRARLHGLDDALLDEARRRGRAVGDDAFQLVATDTGLVFCRPSISFALTASWDEITITRPWGDDPSVLPVRWPGHGELKFTVSRRLAANIFRRWLQLRMQADRRARETSTEFALRHRATGEVDRLGADRDAETTGEPAGASAGLVGGASRTTGRTGEAAVAVDADRLLDGGELELVPRPDRGNAPPSWVGSAVSLAALLVVLSTIVVIASVSVGVYRNLSADGRGGAPVALPDRTTIDHERYRPASDPTSTMEPEVTTPPGLPGSSAGGASQVDSTSNQQLLAVSPGSERNPVLTPVSPSTSVGARRCSSNYSGCVPDVSDLSDAEADVDCLGQGDGPFFADGEVVVLGADVYGLDTDGDGRACEPGQPEASPSPSSSARSRLSGD